MRVRSSVLVSLILLVSGTGWSQTNRLGDVAGSIKLDPSAIVEKEGYVEDPQAAVRADRDLFGETLRNCSTVADHLGALVEEARNSILYRDGDLPSRMSAASLDLESQIQALYLLRLTESLAESAATARSAADECAAAGGSVREELARRGVGFTEANEMVAQCRQSLDLAEEQLASADNRQPAGVVNPTAAATKTSEPARLMSVDEIVDARCESERSNGEAAIDACRSGQYRAEAAMASRTADNEMMAEAVFTGIRGICQELHPRDFVLRNNCELDKMTTARLEQE